METDRRRRVDAPLCSVRRPSGRTKKKAPDVLGAEARIPAPVMSLAGLAATGVAHHYPGQTEQ